jgi:hypothetical protein
MGKFAWCEPSHPFEEEEKGIRKMAIDLEAIRRRMAELNGTKKTSSVQLWKPGPGEYKIRCLPWKDAQEGQPFIERWFYYIGNNAGILTPKQFGKPDPIDDLIRKLYSSGKPDDRNLARQLQPKMRAYAPVIVRGQEDKGPMVWAFGKIVYQRLLGFFVDEDYGNIIDPYEGFDLKVTISQQPGKQFQDTVVDCKGRPSKLHDDASVIKKWLDSVPNIDDMYRLKTKEEIENVLNTWLNGGDVSAAMADEGVSRGPAKADALDDLVKDVKSQSKPAAKPAAKKPSIDDVDLAPAKKQSLDEAFEDLMNDD